jgi:hypothetical protein
LAGARTFPAGDFTHHFFPFSLFQHRALSAARLPIWNPYTYAGHPFLADVQAAVYYPVSNLLLLMTLPLQDAAARLYLLQVDAVLHLFLAGLCFALLACDLTGSRLGGIVGGVCFAFSGYLTGYPPLQLAVLRTAIWLPLAFWCLLRAWSRPRSMGWWLGTGLSLAVGFLAGHAQTYLFLLYALGGWVVFLALASARSASGGDWRRRATGLLAALAVAGGLSAAQWLPSLEYLQLSVRANVDYAYVSGGFALPDTWQLLLPGVLTQFSPLYIGIAGLELAICAIVWAVGRRQNDPKLGSLLSWRAGVAFFSLLALLALLASYGDNGFLYPLLYRFAPGWKLFRGQERAAYLVTVGLAALASYGAALAPLLPSGLRRRGALVAGAVTVAGVYAFGMLWQLPGRTAIDQWEYLAVAGVTLVVGMALALIVALPGWSMRRSAGLVALLAANLFWANMATNLDAASPAERVQLTPEMAALHEAVTEAPSANGLPGRVYNEFRLYEDYGIRQRIEDVWGSSPLRLARYAALFEGFPLDRMWRLLGVAHVLTWRRELFGPSERLAEFPQSTDTTFLHRLPAPARRAWMVGEIVAAGDEEAWMLLADHLFDLEGAAVVSPEEAAALSPRATGDYSVMLSRESDNRLHIRASSSGGGLLVVAENWMPGWRTEDIRCDPVAQCPPGQSFETVRANLTLVGVPVPAGVVEFDLVYEPDSVKWGLWISSATLLALAGAGGGAAVYNRRQQKA